MRIPIPPIEQFFVTEFGTELIYSFAIIVCSLMVYFGTRELYKLTSHKGMKYFRQAFLFFAIAYFFRSFIKFALVLFNTKTVYEIPQIIFNTAGYATLLLFMYFSSMAVFYLLYSVMWKKWSESPKLILLFHALAVIISVASIISRNSWIILGINLFLLGTVSFVFLMVHKDSKKKKNTLYFVYMLLFIFWILNLIDIFIPSFMQGFQLIAYLASMGIFLAILYKVLKKSGN